MIQSAEVINLAPTEAIKRNLERIMIKKKETTQDEGE